MARLAPRTRFRCTGTQGSAMSRCAYASSERNDARSDPQPQAADRASAASRRARAKHYGVSTGKAPTLHVATVGVLECLQYERKRIEPVRALEEPNSQIQITLQC